MSVDIVASRSSGLAPLSVHFECSAEIDTDTDFDSQRPRHDFRYVWGFDDPGHGVWPHSGMLKNAAIGPEAFHCFESAGTYTVTCDVYEYDSNGNVANYWSRDTEITVTDTWTETYLVSDTGDFTGAPSGTDYEQYTTSDLSTVIGYASAGRRILLRPGGTWTYTADGATTVDGPVMVGSWDESATDKPIISAGGTSPDAFRLNGADDWRIVGLLFAGNDVSGARGIYSSIATQHLAVIRCDFVEHASAAYCSNTSHNYFAFIECTSTDPIGTSFTLAAGSLVLQGCAVDDQVTGHNVVVYGGTTEDGVLVQHCKLGSNVGSNRCLSIHAQSALTGETSRVIISDNDISTATDLGIWLGAESSGEDYVHDVIVERNHICGNKCIQIRGGVDITIRNNILDVSNGDGDYNPVYLLAAGSELHTLEEIYIFCNTAYNSASSSSFAFCHVTDYTGITSRNNLASSPNDAAAVLFEGDITDVDSDYDLITDDPGWISASPSDPEDFKLDPADTDRPAIDTGIIIQAALGTFGGGDRTETLVSTDDAPDIGAWEHGASDFGDTTTVSTTVSSSTTSMSSSVSTTGTTSVSTIRSTSVSTSRSSSVSTTKSTSITTPPPQASHSDDFEDTDDPVNLDVHDSNWSYANSLDNAECSGGYVQRVDGTGAIAAYYSICQHDSSEVGWVATSQLYNQKRASVRMGPTSLGYGVVVYGTSHETDPIFRYAYLYRNSVSILNEDVLSFGLYWTDDHVLRITAENETDGVRIRCYLDENEIIDYLDTDTDRIEDTGYSGFYIQQYGILADHRLSYWSDATQGGVTTSLSTTRSTSVSTTKSTSRSSSVSTSRSTSVSTTRSSSVSTTAFTSASTTRSSSISTTKSTSRSSSVSTTRSTSLTTPPAGASHYDDFEDTDDPVALEVHDSNWSYANSLDNAECSGGYVQRVDGTGAIAAYYSICQHDSSEVGWVATSQLYNQKRASVRMGPTSLGYGVEVYGTSYETDPLFRYAYLFREDSSLANEDLLPLGLYWTDDHVLRITAENETDGVRIRCYLDENEIIDYLDTDTDRIEDTGYSGFYIQQSGILADHRLSYWSDATQGGVTTSLSTTRSTSVSTTKSTSLSSSVSTTRSSSISTSRSTSGSTTQSSSASTTFGTSLSTTRSSSVSTTRSTSKSTTKTTSASSSVSSSTLSSVSSSMSTSVSSSMSSSITTHTPGDPVITIETTRTSGLAPLCVYFDCIVEDTTDISVDYPFHDLRYVWSFDDPSSGTWAISGMSKNQALGPSAAHVFDNAGTYTVTCNIYQYDSSGRLVNSWYRETEITVTDTWAETYLISDTGDFTGAPVDTDYEQRTTSNWATVMSYAAANRRLLLRPGGTWTASAISGMDVNGPGYIGPWGTGTAPRVNAGATGVYLIDGDDSDDWRIEGVHFHGNGYSAVEGYVCTGMNDVESTDVLLYNCNFELLATAVSTYGPAWDAMAIVDCTSTTPLDSSFYIAGGHGIFMGNECNNQSYNSNGHCFRLYGGSNTEGAVIQHNRLGNNMPSHHAIKAHAAHSGDYTSHQSRIIISDNDISEGKNWAVDVGPQSDPYDEHVQDVIIERNRCAGDVALALYGVTECTVRNNIFDLSDNVWHLCVGIGPRGAETHTLENVWVYHNTAYSSSASSDFVFCNISDYTRVVAKNNIASAPNDSSPEMFAGDITDADISDNILTDDPGWVSGSPSDPEDFKLDPTHTDQPAIDTGVIIASVPETFGADNRFAYLSGTDDTVDIGAWEAGADLPTTSISTTRSSSVSTTRSTSRSTTRSSSVSTTQPPGYLHYDDFEDTDDPIDLEVHDSNWSYVGSADNGECSGGYVQRKDSSARVIAYYSICSHDTSEVGWAAISQSYTGKRVSVRMGALSEGYAFRVLGTASTTDPVLRYAYVYRNGVEIADVDILSFGFFWDEDHILRVTAENETDGVRIRGYIDDTEVVNYLDTDTDRIEESGYSGFWLRELGVSSDERFTYWSDGASQLGTTSLSTTRSTSVSTTKSTTRSSSVSTTRSTSASSSVSTTRSTSNSTTRSFSVSTTRSTSASSSVSTTRSTSESTTRSSSVSTTRSTSASSSISTTASTSVSSTASSSVTTPPQGRPVVTVTPSRSSGLAPLSVFFECDVAGDTDFGVERPFHELRYVWSFDDPGSGTWTHSGMSKNQAFGPVAAHLFETAGAYTVECDVYQYDDDGNLVDSWHRETTITVTDTWTETYIVSDTGDFTGAPDDTDYEQRTTSSWNTVLGYVAANRRVLLRPGGTWTCSSSPSCTAAGPIHIGPWGDGDRPRVHATASGIDLMDFESASDWRIVGLTFDGNGYGDYTIPYDDDVRAIANLGAYGSGDGVSFVTVYDCLFDDLNNATQFYAHCEDTAIIECEAINPITSQFYLRSARGVMAGNKCIEIDGPGGGHGLRFYGGTDEPGGVIQHNRVGNNQASFHSIKVHASGGGSEETSRLIISDNDIRDGAIWAVDIGPQSAGSGYADEHVFDVIVERNLIGSGDGNMPMNVRGATEVTVRNNIFTGPTSIAVASRVTGGENFTLENVWIYHNTGYYSGSSNYEFCNIDSNYDNIFAYDNLASAPNASGGVLFAGTLTNLTEDYNLLVDDPGWVSGSPVDPEDFKLDPSHTDQPAINTGVIIPGCPGTFGGSNRFSSLSHTDDTVDLGAWEVGADEVTTSISTTRSTSISTTRSTSVSTSYSHSSSISTTASTSITTTRSSSASSSISTTASSSVSSTRSTSASTPPPSTTDTVEIGFGESWRQDEQNVDRESDKTDPFYDLGYDTSDWTRPEESETDHNAVYYYGVIDDLETDMSLGTQITDQSVNGDTRTQYFAKLFTVSNSAAIVSAHIDHIGEDGIYVWLNGTLLTQDNVTGAFSHGTIADSPRTPEGQSIRYDFGTDDVGLLVDGDNWITVAVCPRSADSTDMAFDLRLVISRYDEVATSLSTTRSTSVSTTKSTSATFTASSASSSLSTTRSTSVSTTRSTSASTTRSSSVSTTKSTSRSTTRSSSVSTSRSSSVSTTKSTSATFTASSASSSLSTTKSSSVSTTKSTSKSTTKSTTGSSSASTTKSTSGSSTLTTSVSTTKSTTISSTKSSSLSTTRSTTVSTTRSSSLSSTRSTTRSSSVSTTRSTSVSSTGSTSVSTSAPPFGAFELTLEPISSYA